MAKKFPNGPKFSNFARFSPTLHLLFPKKDKRFLKYPTCSFQFWFNVLNVNFNHLLFPTPPNHTNVSWKIQLEVFNLKFSILICSTCGDNVIDILPVPCLYPVFNSNSNLKFSISFWSFQLENFWLRENPIVLIWFAYQVTSFAGGTFYNLLCGYPSMKALKCYSILELSKDLKSKGLVFT